MTAGGLRGVQAQQLAQQGSPVLAIALGVAGAAATQLPSVVFGLRHPFLHMTVNGYSIAYQPGMVNGLYISDGHFVAPDPHGPISRWIVLSAAKV